MLTTIAGTAPGKFDCAYGIAVSNTNGNIYVNDRNNRYHKGFTTHYSPLLTPRTTTHSLTHMRSFTDVCKCLTATETLCGRSAVRQILIVRSALRWMKTEEGSWSWIEQITEYKVLVVISYLPLVSLFAINALHDTPTHLRRFLLPSSFARLCHFPVILYSSFLGLLSPPRCLLFTFFTFFNFFLFLIFIYICSVLSTR